MGLEAFEKYRDNPRLIEERKVGAVVSRQTLTTCFRARFNSEKPSKAEIKAWASEHKLKFFGIGKQSVGIDWEEAIMHPGYLGQFELGFDCEEEHFSGEHIVFVDDGILWIMPVMYRQEVAPGGCPEYTWV